MLSWQGECFNSTSCSNAWLIIFCIEENAKRSPFQKTGYPKYIVLYKQFGDKNLNL